MSVTFVAYVETAPRRFDFAPGTPEVNFSNANAGAVLAALGLDLAPDYCGQMSPAEFFVRVRRFRTAVLQGRGAEFTPSGVDPTGVSQALAGATIIDCTDRTLDGLMRRMVALREVALFAQEHDAMLGWG